MDNFKIKITVQAKIQMFEIFTYIRDTLKAPMSANRLLDEVEKNILSLNSMPKRVALINEEPWHSHGIHKMPVKNFNIYFTVNEKQKEVSVIAVIYGRRDQLEQLKLTEN